METPGPTKLFLVMLGLSIAIGWTTYFGISLFCDLFGEMLKDVLSEVLQKTGGG